MNFSLYNGKPTLKCVNGPCLNFVKVGVSILREVRMRKDTAGAIEGIAVVMVTTVERNDDVGSSGAKDTREGKWSDVRPDLSLNTNKIESYNICLQIKWWVESIVKDCINKVWKGHPELISK